MKALSAFLTLFVGVVSAAGSPAGSYHVVKQIPVPGSGSWDYLTVDEAARRLYVSHETEVEVLDVDTEVLVGRITDTPGVHGIALAPEFGRGFVSNGRANSVAIFDLKTLQQLGQVKTGEKPDAIIYDPATHRVFAFNGDGNSATVIEAQDGKVAGTIDLGGGPEFAAADGQGYVFNNLEEQSELVKLDARKLKVVGRWPLAPCKTPSSMAMDRVNRRLFIGCRSHVMAVVNADDGRVITTLPIGDHVDSTVFDASTGLIFNSNGDGTVTVIHEDSPDTYHLVETVKTLPRAKTMALDPKTHKLFLSTVVSGTFRVLVVGR